MNPQEGMLSIKEHDSAVRIVCNYMLKVSKI